MHMKKQAFNKRRLKYGSLATVLTVGFLVALVLVNVIVSLLLERFPLDIDLTKDNRFALTEDSIDYIQDLSRDVRITVLADESDFKDAGNGSSQVSDLYKQAYEVLKNYTKYSNRLALSFVDPVKNPTVTQKYPNESFSTGDIIVESDLRMKKVALSSLFSSKQSQYDGSVTYRSEAEQNFTSAIMYVTDDNPVSVSLLTGFDTPDVSAYTDILKSNNYEVVEQDLLTEEINPAASFVVLPQPSADLNADQVRKLETYLDNDGRFGKGLVFIASRTAPVGPVLKNFLADWGVEISDGFVFETDDRNVLQSYYNILVSVEEESITEKMGTAASAPLMVSYARPMRLLFTESTDDSGNVTYTSGNRRSYIVARTPETSVEIPADFGEDFDPFSEEQQSFPAVVMTARTKYDGATPLTSYVVSIASSEMVSSAYMTYQMFSNGSLMAAINEQLAAKKSQVTILPMDITVSNITITQGQVRMYLVVLVVLVPLFVLAAGVAVWLRRRHL